MTNVNLGEVILGSKRVKNIYVVDLSLVPSDELTYLSVQSDNTNLWHHRLGHMNLSLLNKLVTKDLVCGIPKFMFFKYKIFDVCVSGKHNRSFFK